MQLHASSLRCGHITFSVIYAFLAVILPSCIFVSLIFRPVCTPQREGVGSSQGKIKLKKFRQIIIANRPLIPYPTPPPPLPENKHIIRSISGKKILHCGIHKRIHLTLKHNTTISEYFVEFTLPTFQTPKKIIINASGKRKPAIYLLVFFLKKKKSASK